jgi:hypothetical protein
MTARQPRRTRRRVAAPAAALPRPSALDSEVPTSPERAARRTPAHHREHHVTKDYSHVHRDLLTVLGVGIVVIGFIVGMSFVV